MGHIFNKMGNSKKKSLKYNFKNLLPQWVTEKSSELHNA
jgi:hypothetical protein